MKIIRTGVSAALILALGLAGCAANETTDDKTNKPAEGETTKDDGGEAMEKLSGNLAGMGASSAKEAQIAWIAKFQEMNPDVTVNYAPEGSGAGREAFQGGGADFAGSDRAFKDEEMDAANFSSSKCAADALPYNLPVYISPIAIIFNVEGVDSLKLDAKTVASIFKGDIKNWNDEKISALNEGVEFPDMPITFVHRSDESGTTENFTDTLKATAPDVWDAEVSGDWQYPGGEAAKGTSGVVDAVKNGKGTIGYADASQVGDLKTAEFSVDGKEWFGPTAEAAAKVVESSPRVEGRADHDMAIELDRTAAGYPLVLLSYAIVCSEYKDAEVAKLVKAYVGFMGSEEGQKVSQENAGSAPLSAKLSEDYKAAIDSVK